MAMKTSVWLGAFVVLAVPSRVPAQSGADSAVFRVVVEQGRRGFGQQPFLVGRELLCRGTDCPPDRLGAREHPEEALRSVGSLRRVALTRVRRTGNCAPDTRVRTCAPGQRRAVLLLGGPVHRGDTVFVPFRLTSADGGEPAWAGQFVVKVSVGGPPEVIGVLAGPPDSRGP